MMEGKVVIVTGSNSGIGKATAKALAGMGATIVMAVRNHERGVIARAEIVEETENESVSVMVCDLASRDSIKRFSDEFKSKYDKLDVLINNAGAVFAKRQLSDDGIESSMAVNYLGPFLLTRELLPLLEASAPSRIINVSSGLSRNSEIDFDDLQREKSYKGMQAYSGSKLMLTTYTLELARRLAGTGVTANVVEPGFVATNLGRNSGSLLNSVMFTLVRPMQITPEKAAENSVYTATSPELNGVTGLVVAKKQPKEAPPITQDGEARRRLWEATLRLLGFDKDSPIQAV
jgi:NAD(P)-dependent dehydrogenase (short-subunit alcohol dehydrogenase family)